MDQNGNKSVKKWYVVRTSGGKEIKVKEFLEKNVIDRPELKGLVNQILVPTEKYFKEKKTKNGPKKVETEKVLFSGYIFIEACLTDLLIEAIRQVPGVLGFLTEEAGPDKRRIPVPLSQEEINRIIKRQDEATDSEGQTVVDVKVGEPVQITDGPFSGFDGTVEEIIEDRSKLKVVVMIFGRKTLLELSFTQVKKIN